MVEGGMDSTRTSDIVETVRVACLMLVEEIFGRQDVDAEAM